MGMGNENSKSISNDKVESKLVITKNNVGL